MLKSEHREGNKNMQTKTHYCPLTNGCQSTLGDSAIIPVRYWNPGMETTRGLIRGGFCAHATCLTVNVSGSMIARGCWTSAADRES